MTNTTTGPTLDTPEGTIGWILANVTTVLDLPVALHTFADAQYRAVGSFLADGVVGDDWDLYPQGSFLLNTVVLPMAGAGEFDLDMVCKRNIYKASITQAALKAEVGSVLADYVTMHSGEPEAPTNCTPSRRCWTLHYPGRFHMDVLPAIFDTARGGTTAILLTDKELVRWLPSDPIGYAEWFRKRMATEFMTRKMALAAEARKSLETVPDWEVKTTLQQTVQVLKAHRDVHFASDLDDRPPSILITTLAAYAYAGENTLTAAVVRALDHMGDFIEQTPSGPSIMSPISEENFADKWREYPTRQAKFFSWLDHIKYDIDEAMQLRGLHNVSERLSKSFGESTMEKAAMRIGTGVTEVRDAGLLKVAGAATGLGVVVGTAVPKHTFWGSHDE